MNGLQETKRKCPKATIGKAIQELMGLGRFSYEEIWNTIRISKPVDSQFSIDDIWKVIMMIQSIIDNGKIVINKTNDNYREESEVELMRIRGHHFQSIALPPISCHTSNKQTWELLSSEYEIK